MLMRVDPFQQVDHLLRSALNDLRLETLPVDTYRLGDAFVAEIDLPGVDRDSIDVTVEDNMLHVAAHRSARYEGADEVALRERRHGAMTRQLLLADGLDMTNITASYDDGVLRLEIPIAEEARPRKVEVTSGPGTEQSAIAADSAA